MRIQRFAMALVLMTMTVATVAPRTAFGRERSPLAVTTPEALLSAASQFGMATLGRDGMDDPMIRGQIGDKDYVIYFYGCTNGQNCTNVMFLAYWASDDFTDERMGDWNRKKRFGKAYLDDDGNPAVEMNVNLFGGISRTNLADTFDWWRLIMVEFAEFCDF